MPIFFVIETMVSYINTHSKNKNNHTIEISSCFISKSHLLKYKNSKLRECKRDFKYAYEVHRYLEIRVCFEMAKKRHIWLQTFYLFGGVNDEMQAKGPRCNRNEDNKWLKIPFFKTISQKSKKNRKIF